MLKLGVITVSDKGARGERDDGSGPVIRELLAAMATCVRYEIIPDEAEIIARTLREWSDDGELDIILTTGGTGLAARDVTPEATLAVVDKPVPGLAEVMRAETARITPMAMLSRAAAGIRGRCLIVNLPGSPKAVRECLEVIMPVLLHAVEIIQGKVTEHGPPPGEAAHDAD